MKKSYAQIVKQIEALKLEADKLRRSEIDGVVARIREAISFYGLSAADLGLGAKPARAAQSTKARPGPKPRKPVKFKAEKVVKFRNESGGTWGGRGKRPQWLRDALANGKALQDFAVL